MSKHDISLIKKLRQQTGMNLKDIVKALDASDGDIEKAKKWLRENTKVKFSEASDVKEGCIGVYVHHNKQVASIVLLACSTDFTARNDAFMGLANDLALHITSAKPVWVSVEDIPEDILNAEREILASQTRNEGKPDKIVDKIVEGRLRKFYEDNVLMEQKFVKDDTLIKDMVKALSAKTGEAVIIKSFSRKQVG